MRHFYYYPQIEYSGHAATNIMVRGKIRDAILKEAALYYKYTVTDGERPDIIASKYYGNSSYVWAIFYANNMVDPIFDWPLDIQNFNRYIIEKYGSVERAKNTTTDTYHYMLDQTYYIDKFSYEDPMFPDKESTPDQNFARKSKLSLYDYEVKLNDQKREIVVLDSYYLTQITNELRRLFEG